MNADVSDRNIRLQRRTGAAITCWSLLPVAVAIERLLGADLIGSATFLIVAGISLTAAGLVCLPRPASQITAAILLFLISGRFAVQVASLLVVGYGPGALRVADSPAGYVIAVVTDSFFAVPLAVFAVGVWRRRPVANRQLPVDHRGRRTDGRRRSFEKIK